MAVSSLAPAEARRHSRANAMTLTRPRRGRLAAIAATAALTAAIFVLPAKADTACLDAPCGVVR